MKSLSVKFLIITFIFSFLIPSKGFSRNIDLGLLKEACTETGLQSGTEDHADCVMRLYKRDDLVLYEKPNRYNNNTLKIMTLGKNLEQKKPQERQEEQQDLQTLVTIH